MFVSKALKDKKKVGKIQFIRLSDWESLKGKTARATQIQNKNKNNILNELITEFVIFTKENHIRYQYKPKLDAHKRSTTTIVSLFYCILCVYMLRTHVFVYTRIYLVYQNRQPKENTPKEQYIIHIYNPIKPK